MLHYNFPPFCVGETGMMSGPKRREIGHGKLAKRGVQAVMPSEDSFPYAIRVVSENAPSMAMMKIDPDKLRDVIGKGGAVIRAITEETGASIDIDDDGNIRIYGEDATSRDAAIARVLSITAEAEVGRLYMGKVARIVDFGAFITILPGKDGLVHISQISSDRVENINEYLTEGQEVLVKVTDLDARGRIKLSIKEITDEDRAEYEASKV